jgi:hypothetical protein
MTQIDRKESYQFLLQRHTIDTEDVMVDWTILLKSKSFLVLFILGGINGRSYLLSYHFIH